MVHQYKLNGYNIVLDTCSGSVHTVDEVAYDIIEMYKTHTEEEIVSVILERYSHLPDVTREEIEAFLEKQGILFMTDETNMDNQYSRNRIRNEMLPMAERFICQGTVSHIAKTARDVTIAQDFLDTICQKEYESSVKIGEGTAEFVSNSIAAKFGV